MSALNFTGGFSGGSIHFDWHPEPEEIAWQILQTADRLEDRSAPLALSRQIAVNDVREHFEKQESPEGEPWAPWAPSYAPVALATNAGKILQRTLHLEGVVTAPSAYPATDDSLFFNTGVMPEYGFWNYYGTAPTMIKAGDVLPGGNVQGEDFQPMGEGTGQGLPARPMVGISAEAQIQILETFEAWFEGAINETFVRGGRVVAVKRGAGGRFA